MRVHKFDFRMGFDKKDVFLENLGRRFPMRYEILETYPLAGKLVFSILFFPKT